MEEKVTMLIKINDWPLGERLVEVEPLSLCTKASGLRYLSVEAVNGHPFVDGDGEQVFRHDLWWGNRTEVFATESVLKDYGNYLDDLDEIDEISTRRGNEMAGYPI